MWGLDLYIRETMFWAMCHELYKQFHGELHKHWWNQHIFYWHWQHFITLKAASSRLLHWIATETYRGLRNSIMHHLCFSNFIVMIFHVKAAMHAVHHDINSLLSQVATSALSNIFEHGGVCWIYWIIQLYQLVRESHVNYAILLHVMKM